MLTLYFEMRLSHRCISDQLPLLITPAHLRSLRPGHETRFFSSFDRIGTAETPIGLVAIQNSRLILEPNLESRVQVSLDESRFLMVFGLEGEVLEVEIGVGTRLRPSNLDSENHLTPQRVAPVSRPEEGPSPHQMQKKESISSRMEEEADEEEVVFRRARGTSQLEEEEVVFNRKTATRFENSFEKKKEGQEDEEVIFKRSRPEQSDSNSQHARKLKKLTDEERETFCPICYCQMGEEECRLPSCPHKFCLSCIKEWASLNNQCPLCKAEFKYILNGSQRVKVKKQAPRPQEDEEPFIEPADLHAENHCYVCLQGMEHDSLLLVCEHCLRKCCHARCLSPPLVGIPPDEWYCDYCVRDHNLQPVLPTANIFAPQRAPSRRNRTPAPEDRAPSTRRREQVSTSPERAPPPRRNRTPARAEAPREYRSQPEVDPPQRNLDRRLNEFLDSIEQGLEEKRRPSQPVYQPMQTRARRNELAIRREVDERVGRESERRQRLVAEQEARRLEDLKKGGKKHRVMERVWNDFLDEDF